MKQKFWTTDWFFGLVTSFVFLLLLGSTFIQGIERIAYDFGVRASSRDPGDKIAVIAIDDNSISNLGRWPWPRKVLADMVGKLSQAQAKVIGQTIFLSEPQLDPGLAQIRDLQAFVAQSPLAQQPAAAELNQRLKSAEEALDTDRQLAAGFEQAGNAVLAMQFNPGEVIGNPASELPDYVLRNALTVEDAIGAEAAGILPLSTIEAVPPIEILGKPAASIGHLVNLLDVDGAVRTEPLVVRYYAHYFPSQALLIAARSLNLNVADIQARLGEGVQLGRLNIVTDPYLQMQTFFYKGDGGKPVFPVDSFFDVYTGNIKPEKYKDKIVLIGPTAFGLGSALATPLAASEGAMAPVLIMAHTVASILNENFFVAPVWGDLAGTVAFLLVAAYLIAVLPRLRAGMAAGVSAALLVALIATHLVLMTTQGMWLQLMGAATLLFTGHLLLTTKRFLVTERGKIKVEGESAESNRMLGLAFQQQGQLDMAFEKFRKCPMDDSVMEVLYNLALDYERKRQFNKANSVYQYMAQHNPKFRDLENRMTRAKHMEETVMLGGGGGHPGGTMLLADGSVEKPKLGRYEVEKELGKGAMGVVYLGKDPKINRTVAIKTMAL